MVDTSQETHNSLVEGAWQARECYQEIECDLVSPVNVNMMEGSGPADADFANATTEESPLATRMQNDDDLSSGEISDNSSDLTSFETSWSDIHAVSF